MGVCLGCNGPDKVEKTIVLGACSNANITLVADKPKGFYSTVSIKIDGWIDNSGVLKLQGTQPFSFNGYIQCHQSFDWFSGKLHGTYTPTNVTKGVIVIRYRFL